MGQKPTPVTPTPDRRGPRSVKLVMRALGRNWRVHSLSRSSHTFASSGAATPPLCLGMGFFARGHRRRCWGSHRTVFLGHASATSMSP